MTTRIRFRQDTAARWASVAPVLSMGELGVDTDKKAIKMGDGSTAWASLKWAILPPTSYTPTVAQGGTTDIAKTVTYSKYSVAGNLATFQAKLALTGSGTTNNAITVSLPLTAAASQVGCVVGSGYYNDGGTQYQAVAYLSSATTVALLSTHGTASTSTDDPIGVNPNIAVANTDVITLSVSYEVA